MTSLKVDLYSDVICPWCLIGQHRLRQTMAKHLPSVRVDIEQHPVLLLPDCPYEGLSISSVMQARGLDPIATVARPQAEALKVGLSLNLARQAFFYPTLRAHTIIRLARHLGTQHQLALAIATAYFIDIRNISDLHVLADIALDHGFESRTAVMDLIQSPDELEATRQAALRSAARGVRGVPHFVFNGKTTLSGHQSEQAFLTAIDSAAVDSLV